MCLYLLYGITLLLNNLMLNKCVSQHLILQEIVALKRAGSCLSESSPI